MGKRARPFQMRVVIIDDDEDLSAVMVDSLRNNGIQALSLRPVPSCPIEQVVTTACWFKPHAILCDVVMPVNTAKLVAALRESQELEGTKIIGCSAHSLLATPFSRHLDGFLHKPFGMQELADALAELVTPLSRRARRSRGTTSARPPRASP